MNVNQCGELERLAAAAASLDYSHPTVGEISQTERQVVTHLLPNTEDNHTIIASNAPSQTISYIDPYQISRSHQQFVPVRAYESSFYNPDGTVQPLHNSRLVMVTSDPITSNSMGAVQFATRPLTHFTVTGVSGIHYQNSPVGVLPDSVMQPVANIVTPNEAEVNVPFHAAKDFSDVPLQIDIAAEPTVVIPPEVSECSTKPASRAGSKRLSKPSTKRKLKEDAGLDNPDEPMGPGNQTDPASDQQFPCLQCEEFFATEIEFKRHCLEHKGSKRSGLSLETKVDIIKRISSGEKRADMADEYNVNKSTIKSIMKKADNYLMCWKKGMFNPETKRMKGPKREDVEQALYSWYTQALESGTHISGPTLCSKACDFAKKLGYQDFKPSHGWLDRFKKRKKIVFGRVPVKRNREQLQLDDVKMNEWQGSILPQVVYEYDSNNIFAVEKLGILFKSAPHSVSSTKDKRCAGGVHPTERLSVLLCTNMPGKEKLPPLVVGNSSKLPRMYYSKTLPVQYIYHEKSWLTREVFVTWLQDVDSWLTGQNRKICLISGPSPIHTNLPKLRSIRFVVTPHGIPCPLQQMAFDSFKRFYRMAVLENLMQAVTRGASEGAQPQVLPTLPLTSYLSLIAKAWQAVPDNFIVSSFQRSGISRYGVWASISTQDTPDLFGAQELLHRLAAYGYSESISFEDYVHFDDNIQVCNMMADEDILAEVSKSHMNEAGPSDANRYADDLNDEFDDAASISQIDQAFSGLRELAQYKEGGDEAFRLISQLEHLLQKTLQSKQSNKKSWFPEST